MPILKVVEHPCAVCGGPNLRPYPTCENLECRQEWRRRGVARSKRERYALNVLAGKCGDCGVTIRKNERNKDGTGHPIARCAACRAVQAEAKKDERARKAQAKRADKAIEAQIDKTLERHQTMMERAARGLPITKAGNSALPKEPIQRVEI